MEAAKETCADPVVLIEQRVDFSRWVEGGWGTSDAILIADGTMHVIDYKHGLGIQQKILTQLSMWLHSLRHIKCPILML